MDLLPLLPYLFTTTGGYALMRTAGLIYNRLLRKKTPEVNTGLNANSSDGIGKLIDEIAQWKVRYKKKKVELNEKEIELSKYRLESLLDLAGKYADSLYPDCDAQTRAERAKTILPFLARELRIENEKELEQALLIKPAIPDQTVETTKVIK